MAVFNPNFHWLGDTDETRFFEYFRSRTGPQLAGYFPSEFWSNLILKVSSLTAKLVQPIQLLNRNPLTSEIPFLKSFSHSQV